MLEYQSGFRNYFESEAERHTLPVGKNSPQKTPRGLIPEQLSGSSFTSPRKENLRSWLYKHSPSVSQGAYEPLNSNGVKSWLSSPINGISTPQQLRWSPPERPSGFVKFYEGVTTYCANGSASERLGNAVHLYAFNAPMGDDYFCNSDAELLFVPQSGTMRARTEFGDLTLAPGEILVIPRGVKFQLDPENGKESISGYLCENYGAVFQLPELGPIGSNGLANPRDFLAPVAKYDSGRKSCRLITKFLGGFWESTLKSSPLDAVAWHGNYYPYKYDLKKFNTIGTVSFDHPDPSIFTVLTSPTAHPGVANADFVIFPPRWMVAEETFRPPYFHRNTMSEFMGLIEGVYDAKPGGGFDPGGASLHNCMAGHGPEKEAYVAAIEKKLAPEYLKNTLAFMFESTYVYIPTRQALALKTLQKDYYKCWEGIFAP